MSKSNRKKPPIRVLTLDGGGMRGLYTAALLQVLIRRVRPPGESPDEVDLGSAFDLICGTSTGAILACGLAKGLSLNAIIDLYESHGPQIFPDPQPKPFTLRTRAARKWLWRHRRRAAGDHDQLRDTLDAKFGDDTLESVYQNRGIALCIPAVNADTHRAWVFKTPHIPGKHRDNKYRLSEVCRASSAAPIYFPLAKLAKPEDTAQINTFVDGGLWSNNPVLIGLIEALHMLAAADQKNRPIQIISVGTIQAPRGDPEFTERDDIGLLDWKVGVDIVDMALYAQASGFASMATLIADALNQNGYDIEVTRLAEKPKSSQLLSAIGLDKADKRAVRTLHQLADEDADHIHSKMISKSDSEFDTLGAIIQSAEKVDSV